MKKTLLVVGIFALILTGFGNEDGSGVNKTQNPTENGSSKQEGTDYKKSATIVVYKLAKYLYDDGLIIKKQGPENKHLTDEQKKKLDKKIDVLKSEDSHSIIAIADILGTEPLDFAKSKTLLLEENDNINEVVSDESLSSFVESIIKILEEDTERSDEENDRFNKFQEFKSDIINGVGSQQEGEQLATGTDNKSSGNSKETATLSEDDPKELQKALKEGVNKEPSTPSWVYIILTILFAILLAAIYFIKVIYNGLERLKIKWEKDKQKISDLKYQQDRLYNKVVEMKFGAVKDELYEQMNILAKRINDTQITQVQDIRSTHQAKPEPKIFYAQYPDVADPIGFKNIQFESNSKMVYRITRIEGTQARFVIQNDDNTQQYAIGNHGKILKPVCEYLNQPSSSNRTIKVFREGRLEMQNGIWVVVEKLKIKFE